MFLDGIVWLVFQRLPAGTCLLLLIAAIFFMIRLATRRCPKAVHLMAFPPGPPGLPVLGNIVEVNVEHDELFQRLTGGTIMFGKDGIFKSWLVSSPYVFLSSPNTVEVILGSSKHIEKSSDYDYLRPWLGEGLLTSMGLKWKSRRKIITPSFHFKILQDFVGVFQEQSDVLVRKLAAELDKDGFDLFPYITLCTLDIICETAMGKHIGAQEDSTSEYVRAIYKISSIIQSRQSKIWLQPNWMFRLSRHHQRHKECINTLHGFSNSVIQERKAEKKQLKLPKEQKRLAFLDLLIEASKDGSLLSDQDIREEVDTFMFEGHDTTSAAVCWALYLISSSPRIEDKVMAELQDVFGESDRSLTMADLNNLKYLECCIKEALRLYPSVPIMARKLNEDVHLGNYLVPRGTTAMIVTYMLHRNSSSFPHPEQYNPERFTADNAQGRHPYAYIPFSAGPRNCIGQKFALLEEKAIISSVLRRYKLTPLERREDLILLGELILRPKMGLQFNIRPRVAT